MERNGIYASFHLIVMSWLVIILVAVLVSWAESAYNYDYYGGNDNGGGYYSSSAFSESSALEISPCEDSVVQVTYAQVSCDSTCQVVSLQYCEAFRRLTMFLLLCL